jgi:dephospho-CoA kinase
MEEDVYNNFMIKLGIIGGIGSGKSFVAKLFNVPVFNADKEVKYLYKNSRECFKKLNKQIPKFIKSFPISKKELIAAINHNNKNLKKISSIVHPLVRKKMKNFLRENKSKKIVVLDIPLLIENKLYKKEDILVFISSKKNKVINRLKKRKNYDRNILRKLRQNQDALSEKRKLAKYIIDNNHNPNIMKKKIKVLKNKILNERNST